MDKLFEIVEEGVDFGSHEGEFLSLTSRTTPQVLLRIRSSRSLSRRAGVHPGGVHPRSGHLEWNHHAVLDTGTRPCLHS